MRLINSSTWKDMRIMLNATLGTNYWILLRKANNIYNETDRVNIKLDETSTTSS